MGTGSRDLAAGLLLLALCVVVAGSGSTLRLDPAGDSRTDSVERAERPPEDDGSRPPDADEVDDDRGDGGLDQGGRLPLRAFALLVLAASVAVLVALLSRLRISLRRRGDPPVRATALPTGEPLTEDEADGADDLAGALDAGLADLAAGSARNAIVTAWLRLEAACVSERFAPDRSDTPSEFVGRVLASYALDPGAIADLADLYREARFSEHPVTEEQRRAAARALRTLLDGIPTPTGVRR